MKLQYLLPHHFKKIGWTLLVPAALLGLATLIWNWAPSFFDATVPAIFIEELLGSKHYFGWTENNILNEILGVLIIVGGLMVAFSKQRTEDEFLSKIRLDSLVWAVYFNYGVLLLSFLFIYDMAFLWVMILNMFTILLFFIVRFHWQLNKFQKAMDHDE